MKTPHKISLLDCQSNQDFQIIDLKGGTKTTWSVKSYILRGGLQEGVQVVEINNGKLRYAILPTRGMGIWKGSYGDMRLGWDSPVKVPVNPSYIDPCDRGGLGWLKGFNEWIVRCGISSMGAPGKDIIIDNNGNQSEISLNVHGNIANTPARSVSIEITDHGITVRGEIEESMMFGPSLRLHTEIQTELGSGTIHLNDTVTNLSDMPTEHQLLYHINYGSPLLEKGAQILVPFKQVAPRDERAALGIHEFDTFAAPKIGFIEQVYFYELIGKRGSKKTLALLRNAKGNQASVLRFNLRDFPQFATWKNTAGKADGYVTGLEPGTGYPNTRSFERSKARVITLAGGESRTTRIQIDHLTTKKSVRSAEMEIKQLQKNMKPKVHPQPINKFSDI